MAGLGIFDILEGRSRRGAYPLNENHWSNALAWLLDPTACHGVERDFLVALAEISRLQIPPDASWGVERETYYEVEGAARRIDIQLDFTDGASWFIENKIDPGYQDHLQILHQSSLLSDRGFLILITPSEPADLLPELAAVIDADPRIRHVPWREVGRICQDLADRSPHPPLMDVLLRGLGGYRGRQEADPFIRLIKALIEERAWASFYPDDCETAFRERYPEVWAHWEAERPSQGIGNPHHYFTMKLSGLTRRKQGFRLEKTEKTRPPHDPAWGWAVVAEHRVVALV
jgi:hypothetical protein